MKTKIENSQVFRLIGYGFSKHGKWVSCEDVAALSFTTAQSTAREILSGNNDFELIEIYRGNQKVLTLRKTNFH